MPCRVVGWSGLLAGTLDHARRCLPDLVPETLDRYAPRLRDPGFLHLSVHEVGSQNSPHEHRGLESDRPDLVGLPENREVAQGAALRCSVLRRGSRQAQTLLAVMADSCEKESRPRTALGHLRKQPPQLELDFVLQLDEAAKPSIADAGCAAPSLL